MDFLLQRWVNVLEWVRLPGDTLGIVGGALPLVWMSWQAVRYPNMARTTAGADVRVRLFTLGGDEAASSA